MQKCMRILTKVQKHESAYPFQHPVDTTLIADYLSVVKCTAGVTQSPWICQPLKRILQTTCTSPPLSSPSTSIRSGPTPIRTTQSIRPFTIWRSLCTNTPIDYCRRKASQLSVLRLSQSHTKSLWFKNRWSLVLSQSSKRGLSRWTASARRQWPCRKSDH